jgi:hypothetical protein
MILGVCVLTACRPADLVRATVPSVGTQPPSSAHVLRSVEVKLNPAVLTATNTARFRIAALGQTFTVERLRTERPNGGFVWVGRVVGDKMSLATFAVKNDIVSGTIRTGAGELIEFRWVRPGVHVIRALDATSFRPEAPPLIPPPAVAPLVHGAADACNEMEPSVVNVAVHYTPAVRDAYGGDPQIQALAEEAIAASNQSFIDTGMDLRFKLAHNSLVEYEEVDSATDLRAIAGTGDGEMDGVHALRDGTHADVVVLLSQLSDACGRAYLMTDVGAAFASSAFGVVDPGCAVANFSFAHEVGHIMGARHDRFVDTGTTPFAYAHGWVDMTTRRRSIMAYDDECAEAGVDCPRLGRWSNPDQRFGAADGADNRRVLDDTVSTVSEFRCGQSPPVGSDAAAVASTSLKTDDFGNFWYLDRRSQPVTIEMTNTGFTTWGPGYALVLAVPADNKNHQGGQLLDTTKVELAAGEQVPPGGRKVFSFSFVGNGRADSFQWQMQTPAGVFFGDRTPNVILQPKGF